MSKQLYCQAIGVCDLVLQLYLVIIDKYVNILYIASQLCSQLSHVQSKRWFSNTFYTLIYDHDGQNFTKKLSWHCINCMIVGFIAKILLIYHSSGKIWHENIFIVAQMTKIKCMKIFYLELIRTCYYFWQQIMYTCSHWY